MTISGGTFNTKAPSFPFLETTWRAHLGRLGAPIAVTMPFAGFYPKGGGELDAWIEPASILPVTLTERGPLVRVRAIAGRSQLPSGIAERMLKRAEQQLAAAGITAEFETVEWDGPSPGVALTLIAEHEGAPPATFIGLGERGKPAEQVADEAVEQLLAFEASDGAVDPHSADQIMLPLALASGRSEYTVSEVTDHLRTNADTIAHFLDRSILIEDAGEGTPGRVIIA